MELIVVVFLSLFTIDDVAAYVNAASTYNTRVGYQRFGMPFKRLTVNSYVACLSTCSEICECQSINAIQKQKINCFQCELFNATGNNKKNHDMINSENSTYYELVSTTPSNYYQGQNTITLKSNCAAFNSAGGARTGVYLLSIGKNQPLAGYCDMQTTDGGWTLLQRRFDGTVDFYRDWNSYKRGFGDICSEFWFGLDAAHELTKDGDATLRFDLWDGDKYYYIEYYKVVIASEEDNYRINYSGKNGNASDAMGNHNGQMFSTKDRDNDLSPLSNCAVLYTGAWWYNNCHQINLNGKYGENSTNGINWGPITGYFRSLSKTEMKLKK